MRRKSFNIHERFLRHIWSNQYLKNRLEVADGRLLKVLDVGKLNSDGGPDFRNAKIKIGATTYAGDVEIHRTVFDWIQHQHQEDAKYNSVILHVVLEADGNIPQTFVQSGRQIPTLVLGNFLSDSIHTIWQKAILDERAIKSDTIRCYDNNSSVSPDIIESWLYKLSIERLEIKLRRFEERLKQLAHERKMTVHERQQWYGINSSDGMLEEFPPLLPELTQKDYSQKEIWEQILYEGVMEGLGYSKNREPFLRLAKNLTLKQIRDLRFGIGINIEAALFGIAGLIPKKTAIKDAESKKYIYQLKKQWKEFRPQYHGEILNEADWQFFPTRPANFPTVRLAAAAGIIHLFLVNDFFRNTIQLLKNNLSINGHDEKLIKLFSIEINEFWKNHHHFNKPSSKHFNPLGVSRINDLIINAVLPVALLYARIFKDRNVREGVLDLYRKLPAPESNSIMRLMEKQFLKKRIKMNSVCRQQAIIQLYKYYCSENRCADCEIGQMFFK